MVTASPGEFTASCTLYLLGSNFSGSVNYVNVNTVTHCYGAKVWQSSTLVRSFVPHYSTAESAAGLYDMVSDVFYPSAGSVSFTYA